MFSSTADGASEHAGGVFTDVVTDASVGSLYVDVIGSDDIIDSPSDATSAPDNSNTSTLRPLSSCYYYCYYYYYCY